jgi:putative membrane protein
MKLNKITGWLLWLVVALAITAMVDALVWKDIPKWLMPVNTVMTFIVALLHAGQRKGWRQAVIMLVVVFVVSITFESFGVATGVVYGPYQYSDLLGPKLLGLVPVLIPIAWFMMMYASFSIADLVIPSDLMHPVRRRWAVAAVGAIAMTAWDLAMDPLMSAGGYWVWEEQGAFFNVPLQNFWGWWLTSFTALFLYQVAVAELKIPANSAEESVPSVWAVFIYIILGATSVTMDFVFGLAGAGLAGLFAMLPWVVAAFIRLGLFRT